MLTDDGRRTMHDDGRQPMTIGHLSDSGDLKIILQLLVQKSYFNYWYNVI